jgi:tetratricopeptide (TPR) repeat protein
MLSGHESAAWKAFHLASRTMGTLESTPAETRRAILGEEATKRWKGDPHERAMSAYYKGILYWRRGELDNASACFKSGLLADGYSETGEHQVDFAALSFLLGWVSYERGRTEQARYSFVEAAQYVPQNLLYDDPAPGEHNILTIVEIGQGPRKVRTGMHGSVARYERQPPAVFAVEIRVDGVSQGVSAQATDLYHQAMTRGKQVLDGIRKGKAIFKTTATTAGIVMVNRGARRDDTGLMIAGAGVLLAGMLTNPAADVRYWSLLPDSISFLPLRLASGMHEVEIIALDEAHRPIAGWSEKLNVNVTERDDQLWWVRTHFGQRIYGLFDPPDGDS